MIGGWSAIRVPVWKVCAATNRDALVRGIGRDYMGTQSGRQPSMGYRGRIMLAWCAGGSIPLTSTKRIIH